MVVRLAYLLELQTLTMFVLPPNGTTSVVGYAVAQANVLSLWIGNNDVLGYATTGGDGSINYSFCSSRRRDLMLHMMLW
jgi:hypothetical protein